MIIGTGIDICDIRRIEATIARFGERFIQRVFTKSEQARANRRPALSQITAPSANPNPNPNPHTAPVQATNSLIRNSRAATYAKRFAAKEACAKALGTGFRGGVFMCDISVVNLPSGKPTLILSGGAARRLAQITPKNTKVQIDLSLTDDYPLSQAIVIISTETIHAENA